MTEGNCALRSDRTQAQNNFMFIPLFTKLSKNLAYNVVTILNSEIWNMDISFNKS